MNPFQITDALTLAQDADARRMAFVGMSGSGKTSGAKVVVEKLLHAGRRVAILDPAGVWHGMRLAADGQSPGLPFVVFGGRHADVPLESTAGAAVADLVMEEHLPVILDLSEFEDDASLCRVSEDFVRRLRRLQNPDREPLLLVVDEADLLAPQNPTLAQKGSQNALINAARRSRSDGLGLLVITQRPAAITKDVLTQAEAVFLMRFSGYTDLKAVEDWIGTYLTLEERKSVVSALPTLSDGECFVTSPSWMHTFQRLRFPLPETFDSSATPKAGARRPRMEARAEVDRAALAARFASAIREEQESDPAVLKARIAELERRVREAKPERVKVEIVKEVPVYVSRLEDAHVQRLTDKAEDFRAVAKDHINLALELVAAANEILTELRQPSIPEHAAPHLGQGRDLGEERGESLQHAPKQVMEAVAAHTQPVTPPPPKAGPTSTGKGTLSRPQQSVLNTLAQLAALGLPQPRREHVAVFAGQSPKSSAFTNNLGTLRTAGLIDYPASGLVTLTQAGQGRAAPVSGSLTRRALHDGWLSRLPAPQQRILRELIGDYPNSLSRESLANCAGASATSSAYTNNLGALRSLGLIDYPARGEVAATSLLFPKGLPE